MPYWTLELNKLLHLPAYRYSWMLVAIVAILLSIWTGVEQQPEAASWINAFVDTTRVSLYIATLSLIVVATQFVASEYQNKTIQLALTTGLSRFNFLAGKVIALLLGTYILIISVLILTLGVCAFVGILQGQFSLQSVNMFALLITFIAIPLKIWPLMVVAVWLSTWVRSVIFPLAFLLSYLMLGELIITTVLSQSRLQPLLDWLPGQIFTPIDVLTLSQVSLAQTAGEVDRVARTAESLQISPLISVIGILGYVIVSGILAYLLLRRQDLSR